MDIKLYDLIKNASDVDTIIFGDFNYRNIRWPLKHLTDSQSEGSQYLFESMYLEQLIAYHTRFRIKNNPSLLDIVQ